MKNKQFNLNVENRTFYFELDENGYVWFLEDNKGIKSKTNIGQTRGVNSIHDAREVAKAMMYARGMTKKYEK